jgi:glycosyltransferase involved in cell wall biosynthesis
MDRMTRPTIIIPCHNEAGSIGAVLDQVKQQVPDADLIVVDDGSTDQTAQIVRPIKNVRLVQLKKNQGKGIALFEGIKAAQTDRLIFMDGDGQDAPEDLHLLIDKANEGYDFVNGSKFIGGLEKGAISFPNYWGNRFMSGLINLLFGASITDSQSGFRAVSKKQVSCWNLTSVQYEIETEMLCKAYKSRLSVVEVPVTRKARTAGKTGFKRIRNGLRVLLKILAERFSS